MVVVAALDRTSTNREVLAQAFRVVAKGASVEHIDDRLRLALRDRDRRSGLRKCGPTSFERSELMQQKGLSSHRIVSRGYTVGLKGWMTLGADLNKTASSRPTVGDAEKPEHCE